jgi:hypothetical protein
VSRTTLVSQFDDCELQYHDIHHNNDYRPDQLSSYRGKSPSYSLHATSGGVCWIRAKDLGEALEDDLYELIWIPFLPTTSVGPVALEYIACRLHDERTSANVLLISAAGARKSVGDDRYMHLLARRRLPDQEAYWQSEFVCPSVSCDLILI